MSHNTQRSGFGGRGLSGQRQRRKRREGIASARHLLIECLETRRLLSLAPLISEVEASNGTGIVDAAGVTADWLEICNPDPKTAVNLAGWSLNYQKTGSSKSTTWTIPSSDNVILGPGESRVFFCDSTSATDPEEELHTNFNLSKAGATVELVNASSSVISTLTYPALASDISYGVGQTVTDTSLVAAGATASYYAPTNNSLGTTWTEPGFNDTSWASGPTGLGTNLDYSSVPGFAATLYQANTGVVASLAQAEAVISTPSEQTSASSETESDLNFMGTGGGGHFSSDNDNPWYNEAFPGMTVGEAGSDYVVQATGTIAITSAGYYTFGVSSDGGFSLAITGADFTALTNATNASGSNTMAYNGVRSASDTLGTTYLAAGSYPVNLLYYHDSGGAELEFYAAKEGSAAGVTSFDANSILVGDTSATDPAGDTSATTAALAVASVPVAGSSPLDNDIQTNVSSTVKAAIATAGSTSLYSRITFSPTAATLASLTSLTLQMQYDSGYVAYLNGVEIASRNAPASPAWNSAALEYRNSPVQSTTYEDVNITPDLALISPQAVSSITSSGTTATVTLPNNGFFSGETITIAGASQSQYDSSFVIATVDANTFTYTMSGSPVSPATGTITAYPTTDVLAVQSLMATPTDQDFYVSPAITGNIAITQDGLHYFAEPTPGTYNTPGSWQPDLAFSVQHGFFSTSFPLTLSTTTPGASIYYTTDSSTPVSEAIASITYSGTTATVTTQDPADFISGEEFQIANATPVVYDGDFVISVPVTVSLTGTDTDIFTYTLPSTPSANASGAGMTATHGTLYTGPITISTTTDVRAVSAIGGNSGVVSTESYIFLASVINQPADPPGFPTVWGENDSGAPQPASYVMNPQITQNPLYSAGLEQDLLSLPTVSITTDIPNMWSPVQSQSTNPGIYTNDDNLDQSNGVSMEVPASFEYFNSSGTISVQQNMGLQMEGGYGRNPPFQMHNFRMEFSSDYGPSSLNYPLIPGDPVTSFQNVDLKAGFNDAYSWAGSGSPGTTGGDAAQYMRDIFASNSMLAMGQPSFASTYVLLYIDGMFWGLYEMMERPDADFAAAHLGGTAADWEANNDGHEVDGSATNLPYWNAFQDLPTSSSYATTSLAFYEQAQGNNAYFLNTYGTTTNYVDLLDSTNYIDYMLMNFYIGNTDWPVHNFYAAIDTADPTGFKFFSWDAEISLGLINGNYSSNVNVNVLGADTNVAIMYNALKSNPEFDMAFADQARQFLFDNGELTPAPAIARYQSQINTIEQGMVLESARWGDIATSPGPLPNTEAAWLNTADWVTGTFLTQRTSILVSQLQAAGLYPTVSAPEFYVNGVDEYGGTFNPGNALTMLYGPTGASLPAGAVIYYTLDGSDPRLLGGGLNAASDVFQYTGPITLTQGEEVRARVYSDGAWSAISEAEFDPNLSSLRVSEVMYDPAPATAAEIAAGYVVSDTTDPNKDFQFIEIENTGATMLPLGGLQITGGIDFTFPQYEGNVATNPPLTLAPNSYVVAVADLSAFTIRYGAELEAQFGSNWQNLIVAGQFDHHLGNSSDEIELSSPAGVIQDFTYQSSWYPQTHGSGFSLTVRSSTQAQSLWDSSAGWEASGAPNGTPGTVETTPIPLPGSVVINEVLANPTTLGGDMVELYNTTAQAINVGGWWLSDGSTNLTMYQIATGTTIAPGAYLVLTDAKNYGSASGDPGAKIPFSLNKYGFTVCLSSNVGGVAGGYQEEETYGASPSGVAVGLVTTSTGESDFVLLATPNFGQAVNGVYPGAANSLAYVSPIVMTELQYDPSQPTAAETAAGFNDGDDFEYIELYNRSSSTQSLSDYYMGSGVGFTFGWVPDGSANESETLESGASATWDTSALAAGTYTVYADYGLTDPDGNTRDVDSEAQYTITYPGGSTTISIDQSTAVNGQLDLGAITTTGPGQIQVHLMRQSTAAPSQWTLANQVEFVGTGVDLKVGSPALTSFATTSGLATLAPGAYVLLVSDLQAFDFRYGSGLPVAGQYTGHQNNGGELMSLDQFGAADPVTGYLPTYEVDRVNYSDAAPWPTQAAGNGPALIRVHPADYGSDPAIWMASGDGPVTNVGATPAAAGLILDPLPPTVPTGLAGHGSLSPSEVAFTWAASTDTRSDVADYIIYRDGLELGTSTTTSYADTTAVSGTNYTYSVSAVNRDGYASAQSTSIVASLPGVTSYIWLSSQSVEIYFNEPLTSAAATLLSNYTMSGGLVFSAVSLSRDGTLLTLTTTAAVTAGTAYTITMNSLATVSGDQLPASLTFSVTYQNPMGTILDQVWDNLDGNDTVVDLTNPALNPNYPNNPTYSTYLTSFNAPYSTGVDDYGQRVQGYIYPPTTGNYVFWIASDDDSQLWLSTNSSPNNAVEICYTNTWTAYEAWTTYASQQSASIALVAGQPYYIDALMKQGGGGDNLSVAWMLLPSGGTSVPDGSTSVPDGSTSVPAQGSAFSITGFNYGGTNGTTATATLSAAPGFVAGQTVVVSGASRSQYNGTFVVTAVSGATFSYTMTSSPGGTSPSGTVKPDGISYSGTTAIVWLPNNGYSSGHYVDITGASPATYDGVYQITGVATNTFTYTMASTPSATATGTITSQIVGITYSGTTATVWLANNGYAVGNWVKIAGATPTAYDGLFQITGVTTNTFTYTTATTPAATSTGTITVQLVGITYSGTTATVWLPNNGLAAGDWIEITGASPATYDGLYEITGATTNSFTYTMSSTPAATSTGTILADNVTLAETVIPGADLSPWIAGNVDTAAPAAPADFRAAVTGSNNQITLTWSAVQDPTSGIDHYAIYRNGSLYATTTATTYTDTSAISAQTQYSYRVAAVNYDGVQGTLSLAVSLSAIGIASLSTPSSTSVLVVFTEPVDSVSAQLAANYQISGSVTVTSAVLQSDDRTVLLTTSALGAASHMLTVSNVKTRAGSVLPALTGSFADLPSPTSVDIGSPGIAGSASYSGGDWTITGSGGDVWETTDQNHYLYVPATTSSAAVWIVHVASLTGNSGDGGWSKAGIMVRASTTTLAPEDAFVAVTSGNGVAFQWTSSTDTDGPNSNTNTTGIVAPQWLEMTYDGNGDFSTYYSSSTSSTPPTTWTQLGAQETITMPAGGFDVGLFVTAHNNSATSTAVFDYNNFMSASLGSGYVAPPFSVTVNPLATNSTSPALSGTISDPLASLSVRVNGNWYAVANDNGAWTLPAGEITPPLADGTYDVEACGINTSGVVAYDSTVNELTVDTTLPTAAITSPTSPTTSSLSSIAIQFSEPVFGFSEQNLQLTLNGISLPLDGTTLTTSDNQHWTLGNLGGITDAAGTYHLTVSAAGWGVTDSYGNVLSTNASTSWTVTQTLTSITVQPSGGLGASGTEPFLATAFDQFGNPLLSQPQFVWSLNGGGAISSTGVFTPVYATGTETISAASGSVTGSDFVTLPGPAQWAGTSGTSWNSASSWTSTVLGSAADGPGLRGVTGDGIVFNSAGEGGTVNLNGVSPSVANVTFNSAANYTIAAGSGGTLQLANGAGTATLAVDAGSPTISAPLALGSNVMVLPAADSQLTISGGVSGAGMLTVDDQGTVVLSGANSYSGGTAVSDGTLVLTNASAIASGTSLTIGTDATSLFGPAQTASIVTAPTSSAIVFAAATTSVVSVGVGSRVDSAVALSVKPAAMSPAAIDAVFTSHRSAFGPAVASPDMVPASGAWMWLVTGSFANTSDISQTADSNVEALDTVLARFGL